MNSEQEAIQIRQLIADNQNKSAAERLYRWFEGKSTERQDAALALLNRITALDSNVLGGLMAQADADLERNRITKALLELSKQLDETGAMPDASPPPMSKTWIFGVVAIVLAGMVYLAFSQDGTGVNAAFDLTVNLHGPGGESDIIPSGKIKLVLGDHNLPPQDINSNGRVVFDQIPAEYREKPLRVVPIGMRYKVVSQSASSAKESRSITVALAPLPDTTLVRGTVFLPGAGNKPAVGAELDFDNGRGIGTTDEKGHFQVAVPVSSGTQIKVMIQYQGKNGYNRGATVSNTSPLELTLNQ